MGSESIDSTRGLAIDVEVVYALPDEQVVVALKLPPGATVRDAIRQSGLLERFPQIDLARDGTGVFGHGRRLDEPVRNGDRVEIYRQLITDPKERRRQHALVSSRAKRGTC
jgi:uncharacterized protein